MKEERAEIRVALENMHKWLMGFATIDNRGRERYKDGINNLPLAEWKESEDVLTGIIKEKWPVSKMVRVLLEGREARIDSSGSKHRSYIRMQVSFLPESDSSLVIHGSLRIHQGGSEMVELRGNRKIYEDGKVRSIDLPEYIRREMRASDNDMKFFYDVLTQCKPGR